MDDFNGGSGHSAIDLSAESQPSSAVRKRKSRFDQPPALNGDFSSTNLQNVGVDTSTITPLPTSRDFSMLMYSDMPAHEFDINSSNPQQANPFLSNLGNLVVPYVSVVDLAFKSRIENAIEKNFNYILRKDKELIERSLNPSAFRPPSNLGHNIQTSSSTSSSSSWSNSKFGQYMEKKSGIGSAQLASTAYRDSNSIYIQGLPLDISEEELASGKIKKIKIYCDSLGKRKGDGLITYVKPDSCTAAVIQFNNLNIGDGYILRVQRAGIGSYSAENNSVSSNTYEESPDYLANANCESAVKGVSNLQNISRLLPSECQADKYPIAFLRNIYNQVDLIKRFGSQGVDALEAYFMDLEAELLIECCQFGKVIRLVVLDGEVSSLLEGSVAVTFQEASAAVACVKHLHDKVFDGLRVQAALLECDAAAAVDPSLLGYPETNGASTEIGNPISEDNNQDVDDFLNSLL